MQDIQQIFNQIQALKEEQKIIRKEYKDSLENANNYTETLEKAKELREEKKKIETIIQGGLGLRWHRFETIKKELIELNELMTDVAMTTLMNGKSISIKDKSEHKYEPIYKINFKKVN